MEVSLPAGEKYLSLLYETLLRCCGERQRHRISSKNKVVAYLIVSIRNEKAERDYNFFPKASSSGLKKLLERRLLNKCIAQSTKRLKDIEEVGFVNNWNLSRKTFQTPLIIYVVDKTETEDIEPKPRFLNFSTSPPILRQRKIFFVPQMHRSKTWIIQKILIDCLGALVWEKQ